MNQTAHADRRAQQRAIPPLLIDLLMKFGTEEPVGSGTWRVYFDKAARRRVHTYAGRLASLIDQHLDVYAVVGADETLITIGHRLDRTRRH